MLPVCSVTQCCSSHSQITFHGGLRPFCSVWKDFESRCDVEDRVLLGMSNITHHQRISFKTQAIKSFYSNIIESFAFINDHSCPNELGNINCNFYKEWDSSVGAIDELHPHPMGGGKLKFLESYNISDVEEGPMNSADQFADNTDSLIRLVEPEITSTIDITPENPSLGSDSLEMDNDSLSSAKAGFDDFLGEVRDSINTSVNNGGNVVQSSLDTITSEAVDGALSKVFSTFDQTGELADDRLTSFSFGLREATQKATGTSVDVLRVAIVAVEESIAKVASFIVYSCGSAKDLLPPEIRGALNLSEERVTEILRPIGATFQLVYIAIEGLEKSLGLDPNDPVVPFVLFLGTSATLWGFYTVWVYGGYSGDLSPQLTLELLAGKEDAILIDVRPEVLRERDGIPDLRRAARFRYASVTLPEVDGPVRKLLKGGRDLDDILTAAVIRNLKAVQDRYQVIVMDADGSRSKRIARSLRKLGVKRPYLVQGGFQSRVKQGIQVKELKHETLLTLLNEAEAILEDIRPSPVQALKLRNSKCSIGTVISGKLSSFEQPLISNLQSLVRNWIDETFHLDKEVSTCD